MIRVHYNGVYHDVAVSVFRGGEVNVVLPKPLCVALADVEHGPAHAEIIANVTNSNEMIAVVLTNDAIQRCINTMKVSLIIPYMPYGRQDRVCHPGEASSLEAITGAMLASQKFKNIIILDSHSASVFWNGPKIIDAMHDTGFSSEAIMNVTSYVRKNLDSEFREKDLLLVAPDAGAKARVQYETMHGRHGARDSVVCKKTRTKTDDGKDIISLEFEGDGVKDRHCLILDDICDGGRTFAELATQLKMHGAASVHLAVTHGIFSYGNDSLLQESLDTIHTTDSYDGGQDLPEANRAKPYNRTHPRFTIYQIDYSALIEQHCQ